MENTIIHLTRLSGGELQQLAFELLPRVEAHWDLLIHSGAVEGTYKTRKGTPDIHSRDKNNKAVYIQATVDPAKGKMYEDLEKSIAMLSKLDELQQATCVAFVSFEPQPDQIQMCQKLCETKKCSFVLYHGTKIAKLLDQPENQDLRLKYLSIEPDTHHEVGLLEKLHVSAKQLDFAGMTDIVDSIKRMVNISDQMELQIDINNPGHYHVKPKLPDESEFIRLQTVFIVPEEFRHCKSVNEMMRYSYQKQKPVHAEVVRQKIIVGNKVVHEFIAQTEEQGPFADCVFFSNAHMEVHLMQQQQHIDSKKPFEIVISPEPFAPPFPVVFEVDGQQAGGQFLIGLEEIDEKGEYVTLTLSNKFDYDNPVKVEVKVTLASISEVTDGLIKPTDLNWSFYTTHDARVYHRLMLSKICQLIDKGKAILVRLVNSGSPLFYGENGGFSIEENWNAEVNFWEMVLRLESRFRLNFLLPLEIDESVARKVYLLNRIVETGKFMRKFDPKQNNLRIGFTVAHELITLIEEFEAKGEIRLNLVDEQDDMELFGNRIKLGKKVDITSKLRFEDLERAKRKLQDMTDGETVNIDFKLLNDEFFTIFPKFYGTDNLEEIYEKEGLNDTAENNL